MKKITSILLITFGLTLNAQVGNLDTSFGDNGKTITSINNNEKGYSVAIQDDGKILIAGYTSNSTYGEDFICIRYNTNGTLDTSFGTNGIVETDIQTGSDDRAKSIAIQSDGKIVLAGYSDDGSERKATLVRYNSDGTMDNSFGTNGIVLTNFENGQQDLINIIKIHTLTGKIIIGGESIISSTKSKPVLARYNSDGSLDTSFNTTGIKLLWVTNLDYQYKFSVEDLEIKSNGKITAIGWRDFPSQSWSSDYWVCKVNSNGTMDTTFSTDGVTTYNGAFNGHDRGYSMLLKTSSNIVIAGGAYIGDANYDFSIFEISSTGSVVSSGTHLDFGTTVITQDIAYGLSEDNNGKYILVGSSGNSSNKSITLTRVNQDLTIDNSFGTSGKVITSFNSNALNEVFDVVIQNDNKIVVVGYTGNNIVVARYIVEENLSVNDQFINEYSIYPNPTTEFIMINSNENKHKIIIYNSLGQIVKNTKLNNNKINVSNLIKGIYYIKINNSKGLKFVKN